MKKIGSKFGYVLQYKGSGKFLSSVKDDVDEVVDARVWTDHASVINYVKKNQLTPLVNVVRVLLTIEIKPLKTNNE